MANTLISLFAKGAVKLSPLTLRFPSRLIKEEIAPEEAVMTKGLLIVQRPLYRVHILHTTFPKCLHQTHCPSTRRVPRVTVGLQGKLVQRLWDGSIKGQILLKKKNHLLAKAFCNLSSGGTVFTIIPFFSLSRPRRTLYSEKLHVTF